MEVTGTDLTLVAGMSHWYVVVTGTELTPGGRTGSLARGGHGYRIDARWQDWVTGTQRRIQKLKLKADGCSNVLPVRKEKDDLVCLLDPFE